MIVFGMFFGLWVISVVLTVISWFNNALKPYTLIFIIILNIFNIGMIISNKLKI